MPLATPVMQNQFVVRVEGTPPEFSDQSIAFGMNFAKQELMLIVQQSLTASIREHVIIQDWIDSPNRIVTVEILDSNGGINDTIKFLDVSIEDHQVDLNHASSGAIAHIMILSYSAVDLGAGNVAKAYANAMSIIGKP